jgi:hypothetical protein
VDDVLEFATPAAFPATGETGKIYVSTGSNKTYRWSGSSYVEMTSSPGSTDAVPEGATNLYFTAARAISALASTLSSYATQAWVTAQGFATTSSVSSAISALVTGVSSVAGKTGAVTLSSADVSGLAPVATSGAYADLSGKPTIPAAQVNSDWNATSGVSQILNKPTIPAATTDASLLTSGTLADARLSSNVSLDNLNNNFTAGQTITAAANNSALTASYSVTGTNTPPLLDLSGTWNTTGIARGILLNITDGASSADSQLLTLQTASTLRFQVRKDGIVFASNRLVTSQVRVSSAVDGSGQSLLMASTGLAINSTATLSWASGAITGAQDTILARDAANTLALRNGGTAGTPVPQNFRLYNYTDAGLANFERGFMRWNSNVLEIGTEAGGTGTARQLNVSLAGQANPLIFQAAGTGVRVIARDFSTGTMILGPSNAIAGLGVINYTSAASDPTTTTITNGNWQVHRNTTSGVVKLWANNNGTLVSVALA